MLRINQHRPFQVRDCAGACALAQTDLGSYRPLALASADARSSDVGGAGDETSREAEVAEQPRTPVDMLNVGKQPIQHQPGYRYYTEGPSGGPDWGLRFTVCFFF